MGVEIRVLNAGDGKNKPNAGQQCTMHYVGKLTNGTEFDSSHKRNRPFVFRLGVGEVIRGWDEGVAKMSKGEKAELTISPDFGYGKEGVPGIIPPNSVLIFEVELINFK